MPPPEPDRALEQVTDSLLRSDDRFRLLVESVQDYAIFMLDTQGRVVSWNAGAERLKGWRADEIIGRSFETFYPDDVVASGWPQEELRRAVADGRIEDEGWRLRKDGTRFWASVVITALRDRAGVLQGYAKVTRDLTQRRAQEEALRASEEQFRLLMAAVKDYAIFMLDTEGRVLTWNAGAQAIKGYTRDEVQGRHFSMFFTADDVAAGVPGRELAQARTEGRAEAEGWRVRKDGSVFWANAVITPVLDGSGQLRGYAKVTRDLTQQRRLTELEHSSRRMNEFLAMLAHELRNPLAPIRNAVSILQVQPGLPPALARLRGIIDRQLAHLTRLVDDLLDVARIATGKILLRRESVDFRAVVRASLEAVTPLAHERGHTLRLQMPDEPIVLNGDATRLTQALQNLLHNAVRYTPQPGEIRLTVQLEGNNVVATVADPGRGIAPQALERIFDLFAQEEGRRSGSDGGLGIGLSLARTLVEQHGGLLTAHSAGLGHGSTFTMRLPLAAGDHHGARTPAPEAEPGRAQRVLVIDDNRDSADTMVVLLELMGHRARAAYGADEGVAAAEAFAPQVVLLDLNMPDGDGYSVLKRLRAAQREPLYVAAMTGYGQKDDLRLTREAGFQAHLTKPVGAEPLRRMLREAASGMGRAAGGPAR